MTEQEFRALLDKYLTGNASPDESKLLDQFFDSYHDNRPAILGMSPQIREEILDQIRKKSDTGIELIPKQRSTIWLKIAATVSFILIASYFLFTGSNATEQNTHTAKSVARTTTRGQKMDVFLPDGTQVRLNSNSHISYPEKFSDDTREVTLDGEAYFKVTHDATKPFIVHTGNTSTTVLGTSFNVHSDQKAVTVTLVEGKVDVSTATGVATLSPNQQAIIKSGSENINTQPVDVANYTAWTTNSLIFDNIPLSEVFATMENWYNVDIEVNSKALNDCIITARYENESLENVMNSLRFMLKVQYQINDHVVVVSGKGCN